MTDGRGLTRFNQTDRLAQLERLRDVCDALAGAFRRLDDPRFAVAYVVVRDGAVRLLTDGFDQADLDDLSSVFPSGPWWLNPKALDYDAPRELWQEEVAKQHSEARGIALDLRTLATY